MALFVHLGVSKPCIFKGISHELAFISVGMKIGL